MPKEETDFGKILRDAKANSASKIDFEEDAPISIDSEASVAPEARERANKTLDKMREKLKVQAEAYSSGPNLQALPSERLTLTASKSYVEKYIKAHPAAPSRPLGRQSESGFKSYMESLFMRDYEERFRGKRIKECRKQDLVCPRCGKSLADIEPYRKASTQYGSVQAVWTVRCPQCTAATSYIVPSIDSEEHTLVGAVRAFEMRDLPIPGAVVDAEMWGKPTHEVEAKTIEPIVENDPEATTITHQQIRWRCSKCNAVGTKWVKKGKRDYVCPSCNFPGTLYYEVINIKGDCDSRSLWGKRGI